MRSGQTAARTRPAPKSGWQRARRPEHKAERRQAILRAAESLVDDAGVDGATLSEIARRAGLSKANCYRYFESREAILLAVVIAEVRRWTGDLADRLEPLAESHDFDSVARAYATATAKRRRLCMLISSLSSVLEHNVCVETVAAFKRAFHPEMMGSAASMRAALPELSEEQVQTFLLFFGLFMAGTWPNANPAPAVAEVLASEEFASMGIDFETALFEHARVLLRGLLAETNVTE